MDTQSSPGEVSPPKRKFIVTRDTPESDQPAISKAVANEPLAEVALKVAASSVIEATSFSIDKARPLDPNSFPDLSIKGKPLSTIANVMHLFKAYGVTARYNVIAKKLLVNVPGLSSGPDNFDNVAMSHLFSLAALNRMSTGQLPSFVDAIGDKHQFNPVATWITSKPWDGTDRFETFCETLVHREGYPVELKKALLRRWLISAVAAIFKVIGFKTRGVLVLQGPQSIGKTAWISELVPDPLLREGVMKLDHHLDPGNKDSIITAVSAWIVEIGELDSSFKKDIARLKGFLTSDSDKLRRPYGRTNSEYPRRTVFTATVNESTFLVDTTGNTRWWTLPISAVNYTHGIDMQQLWAQMTAEFNAGEPWWLTKKEESLLEEQNKGHRTVSVIRERVLEAIDLERIGEPNLVAMSASQFLIKMGISSPTNPQSKECASVLREYLGESKRINGSDKWRVPTAHTEYSASLEQTAANKSSQFRKPVDDDDKF